MVQLEKRGLSFANRAHTLPGEGFGSRRSDAACYANDVPTFGKIEVVLCVEQGTMASIAVKPVFHILSALNRVVERSPQQQI